MTALGVPTFQTKSSRNLFADVPIAPVTAVKSDGLTVCTDHNDDHEANDNGVEIDVKLLSSPSKSAKESPSPKKGGKKLRFSPKKFKPTSQEGSASPKKGASPKSYFSRFLSTLGYSSSGRKSTAPSDKGVYFDTRTGGVPCTSVKTIDTNIHSEDEEAACALEWIPSNRIDHRQNVPTVVRRPEYDVYNEEDDKLLLKKIMTKAKKLPQEPGKYASVHIMINAERAKRNIPPMRRERHMDQIAREQAKLMAEEKTLFHIDTPNELRSRLREMDRVSKELPNFQRMGMNIGKGKTIAEIHRFMMAALAERNNIQDKRFHSMGMGTYIAENEVIYMCHIFGG
mmetsp:Transcript_21938/g.46282  ORF Transcript_21938/g.46282 Transcript_21938/m.46282 type:complete len:341 (+) Transcript_21938:110-1132(+)